MVAGMVALLAACGDGRTRAQQEAAPDVATPPSPPVAPEPPPAPEDPVTRAIRRELTAAFAADPDLARRELAFVVVNGDVSVTGTVATERERRKVNELALGIQGVKSVANAVRVEEDKGKE